MRRMRLRSGTLAGLLALAAGCRAPPAPSAAAPSQTPGRLGFRIGTYLTIEGARPGEASGKVSHHALLIDTVNGLQLPAPVIEDIHGAGDLAEGVRYVLEGYESGAMIGVPPEVIAAGAAPMQQAAWQFYVWFEATSVELGKAAESAPAE